jgi:hypothetical protein
MTETRSISERYLAEQIAQAYYLRTGHLLKTEVVSNCSIGASRR